MPLFKNIKTLIGSRPEPENPQETTQTPQAPRKKVLIVEDDQYLADFYVTLLTREGFDAIKAENGLVGLEKVQTEKPDLIILDIMMPVMDGKEMLHKLRAIEEFKTLPVIVLTNAGDIDNMRTMHRYENTSDFLIKSNVNPEDIIQRVKDLL